MKKLLGIVILGLLWYNFAYSQDCSYIDYKKSKDEFIKCIKGEQETTMSKTMKKMYMKTTASTDFECLNLCKDTVKGMTVGELKSFCIMRCQK